MNKVINFGSLNIDHVYRVPHMVRPGETLGSTGYRTFCGGKGGNQSIALARAGATVYHAGSVGRDGMMLVENLRKDGVNTDHVAVVAEATGHAIIQVDAAGENSIILYPGANHTVTPAQIDAVMAAADPGDILLLQNEINHNARIMEKAAAAGMTLCLNFAPFDLTAALQLPLHLLKFLIVNETEGAELSGADTADGVIDALLRRYPDTTVILTLGKDGVIGADKQQRVKVPSPPAQVVDTTSAGDTFTGYFLAAQLRGKGLQRSLEEGCAAAAVTVSRPGAAESIPCRRELNLD